MYSDSVVTVGIVCLLGLRLVFTLRMLSITLQTRMHQTLSFAGCRGGFKVEGICII